MHSWQTVQFSKTVLWPGIAKKKKEKKGKNGCFTPTHIEAY
jgi:hypothetical protein